MSILLLFGTLFVCLLIGVPIAISLGVSALTAIYFGTTLPLDIVVQKAFTSLDSFPLLAIPFFMLAGILMGKGGVSKRLLTLATSMVGWMTGGLIDGNDCRLYVFRSDLRIRTGHRCGDWRVYDSRHDREKL